jgi:hypothetical protein
MPCPARPPVRRFARLALGFAWALLLAAPGLAAAPAAAGQPLPAWSEGHLEIHHINTGKGESTFLILPDGTTLLIDAGAAPTTPPWGVPARPDASRAPGEWIARYIRHRLAPAPRVRVDYALLSHFHWDHMGAIDARSKKSATGDYLLGGITEVAEHVPFGKVVDRNWPDYNWPVPLTDAKMQNYRRFLAWQSAHRGLRSSGSRSAATTSFPCCTSRRSIPTSRSATSPPTAASGPASATANGTTSRRWPACRPAARRPRTSAASRCASRMESSTTSPAATSTCAMSNSRPPASSGRTSSGRSPSPPDRWRR